MLHAWIGLGGVVSSDSRQFARIAALLLNSGAEIVVQRFLRLEGDFVLLRGRMSGSTDGGKVIIVPYNQIINVSFTKRMTEEDALRIFETWNSGFRSVESSAAEPTAETNGHAVQTGVVEGPSPHRSMRPLKPPRRSWRKRRLSLRSRQTPTSKNPIPLRPSPRRLPSQFCSPGCVLASPAAIPKNSSASFRSIQNLLSIDPRRPYFVAHVEGTHRTDRPG